MSQHCVCSAEVIRFGSMGFFFFFFWGQFFLLVAKMVMILQEYLGKLGNKLNLKNKVFFNIIFILATFFEACVKIWQIFLLNFGD
jgi:hypothetical protein